jgi:uncharacterized protein (DUF4415 family)
VLGELEKMANQDIKEYSLDEIRRKVARGESRTGARPLKRNADIEPDEDFWKRARVVMPPPRGKKHLGLRLDQDVVDWFKAQGRGYQTRMNAVLRSYMQAQRKTDGQS